MNKKLLSKEEQSRACVWVSVLHKTCEYLVVCEKAYNNLKEAKSDFYCVGDRKVTYFEPWTIEKGLSEAALIGLISVLHGSGKSGEGIASDKDLENIRQEMIVCGSKKLGYNDVSEFNEYINSLRVIRDKLVAHYDGTYADYNEYYPEQIIDKSTKKDEKPYTNNT